MPKVLVVGGDSLVSLMFSRRGWGLASILDTDIDLVQFTGGEDVSPFLYGEEKHPASFVNPRRDEKEANVFLSFPTTPKAGICRGGQFLNVMSGGAMWQHVDNHGGSHIAFDKVFGNEVEVTSTHHQMMRPAADGEVLLSVSPSRSSYKQTASSTVTDEIEDVESVFYERTNSLCFQPHPEYVKDGHECCNLYFDYLEKFFNLR